MIGNLLYETKVVRVSNAVAAGSSDITPSAGVDFSGWDGGLFVVAFGAITTGAVTSVKLQQSSDDGAVDTYADIAGSSVVVADDQDNKVALIDVIRPAERYVLPIVKRATQNAVLDGILCLLYRARKEPVTQSSNVMATSKLLVEPVAGTA